MKKNNVKTLLAGLALVVVAAGSGMAQAADASGPYVGLQGGSTSITGSGSTDNTTMYGAYAGYQIGSNFAVELGYLHGKDQGVDLNTYDLSAVPRIAIGQSGFGALIKAGMRYSNASESGMSVSGYSPVIGAGVDYNFDKNISARVMYDYATHAYGVSGTNAGTVTAGVGYKF